VLRLQAGVSRALDAARSGIVWPMVPPQKMPRGFKRAWLHKAGCLVKRRPVRCRKARVAAQRGARGSYSARWLRTADCGGLGGFFPAGQTAIWRSKWPEILWNYARLRHFFCPTRCPSRGTARARCRVALAHQSQESHFLCKDRHLARGASSAEPCRHGAVPAPHWRGKGRNAISLAVSETWRPARVPPVSADLKYSRRGVERPHPGGPGPRQPGHGRRVLPSAGGVLHNTHGLHTVRRGAGRRR